MTGRASRSLKASLEGLNRANTAVLSFATKLDLAAEVEISRATVHNFFAGKPIGRENFHKICQKLELPWQEIAELPKPEALVEKISDNGFEGDAIVQAVRQQGRASLRQRCGIMQVLDMSQPVKLLDIYTSVNILEKISGRRRLEIGDLLKGYDANRLDHLDLSIAQKRVSGFTVVQRYSKLMVLGKPGAGKTTFLKYMALQCSLGTLQAHLVPVFISLKDADKQLSLLEQINEQLATYGIANTQTAQLLSQGKMLILLDGLDEVRETDSSRILQEVRCLVTQFHANHFIITCRVAAQEYTFEQFTEVEIADFNQVQIAVFAIRWFAAKDPTKGHKFVQKLRANRPIQELASNPLLLTLLCLVFEDLLDFPTNRSELYKEAIDILLRKWDAKRNIKRDQVYENLTALQKKILLSQIALRTFERGDYFFTQKEVEQHIYNYIRNLPSTDQPEAPHLDNEAVLKSIEAQHGLLVERAKGIYSFSHLTFHEYFTAKEIVSSSEPQVLERLRKLVSHVTENRWREVFLLSVQMLPSADYLLQLIKQQIDQLAQDTYLQAFLTWVNQKADAATVSYKPAVVRAFYLDLALARALLVDGSLALARTLDCTLTRNLARPLALDLALDRALSLDGILEQVSAPSQVAGRVLERALAHARGLDSQLAQSLQQLKEQLPELDQDAETFRMWWQAEGQAWTKRLNAVVIEYRNLDYDWRWNGQQREALRQYHTANQLLIECLSSSFYVTCAVQDEIEATLLLPIALQAKA